MFIVSVTD